MLNNVMGPLTAAAAVATLGAATMGAVLMDETSKPATVTMTAPAVAAAHPTAAPVTAAGSNLATALPTAQTLSSLGTDVLATNPILGALPTGAASSLPSLISNPILTNPNLGAILGLLQSTSPTINVTWPLRGAFERIPLVLAQGTVKSSVGIASVTINGTPVTLDGSGAFSEFVVFNPVHGLAIMDTVATDTKGNVSKDSRAVLVGDYQPAGTPIDDGLVVRLNQGSFNAICRVIESKISGQMLRNEVMAQNPLANWSSFVGSATINCTSASFGNPSVSLTPCGGIWGLPGFLNVQVTIPNVNVQIQENGSGVVPSLSGWVSCGDAVLTAAVFVMVENGQVTTSIANDSVNLGNFGWGINGIPGFLTGLFNGAVQGAIQNSVSNVVKSAVPPEINKAIVGATSEPLKQTILGTTATYGVSPSAITIDATGLTAMVNVDCSMSKVAGYEPLPSPGSLMTSDGTAPPQHTGPNPDFFASINEDLLNRVGFAAWNAGVTNMRIDNTPGSIVALPAGLSLDASTLELLIPELKSVLGAANPNDPYGIEIKPLLPPVFQATGGNTIQAGLGELQIAFVDEATKVTVLSIEAQINVNATLTLNAQNTFDVQMSDQPEVDASLLSAPAGVNINPTGIDNLMSTYLPTIIQMVGKQWSGFPLPTYPGLVPSDVSIFQDGPQGTFVTASGKF